MKKRYNVFRDIMLIIILYYSTAVKVWRHKFMTEIFLVRHTQAEGNVYRMMQGYWDGGVTEAGILQQRALRERFLSVPVDKVYSSDLRRAVFTAEAISEPKGLEIIRDKRLREINVGPWERAYFGNLFHDEPEKAAEFIFEPETWHIDGAETYKQVGERVYAAIEDIAGQNDGRRVAIVSHGVSIRTFTAKVTGISLNDVKALPIFRNTSVSTFTYDNGRFTPVELNSYYHIENLGLPVFNKTEDIRHEYIDPAQNEQYYKACYEDAWLAAHGSLEGYSPTPYFKSAKEHYAYNPQSVIKLYCKDESVGLVDMDMARGAESGTGWISLLYLKKEYRGKGYGIQALARPIMTYRDMGRKKLGLHVAEDNDAAIKFYLRHGFESRGGEKNLLLMEKTL